MGNPDLAFTSGAIVENLDGRKALIVGSYGFTREYVGECHGIHAYEDQYEVAIGQVFGEAKQIAILSEEGWSMVRPGQVEFKPGDYPGMGSKPDPFEVLIEQARALLPEAEVQDAVKALARMADNLPGGLRMLIAIDVDPTFDSRPLEQGQLCCADVGAHARYIGAGLCLYVSALDNSLCVAEVGKKQPSGRDLPVPGDHAVLSCAALVRGYDLPTPDMIKLVRKFLSNSKLEP